MWIDFKTTNKNPFRDTYLKNAKLQQNSKYQYSIQIVDVKTNEYKQYLKKNRYKVLHVYPNEMARSSNYRNIFFNSHRRPKDGYRCQYCGKRLKDTKIEVDHVYPVRKAKTKAGQRYLYKHGMTTVNDAKNLVPACHYCNQKKKAKTGIWLIRAKLGNYYWYWILRRIIITCLIVLGIGLFCYLVVIH